MRFAFRPSLRCTRQPNARLKQWRDAYKKAFNEDATLFATAGHTIADVFVRAAQKAGPNLTSDKLNNALEEAWLFRAISSAPPVAMRAPA